MDEFKKYLQTVSELNAIASKIEEWLKKNIWSVVGGPQTGWFAAPFNNWPEEIRRAVISGLKVEQGKNPRYVENAYAKFIEYFIGVKLEKPDVLVEKLAFGEDLSDVNIVFTRTWFLVFVDKVHEKTDFILKKARELGIEISASKVVEKPIHELIEEFIQKTQGVMVGVDEFATSVWGLRKIMPSYIKKVYGEIPQEILNVLGFKKLLDVKHVELWGFEDYFTQSAIYCINKSPWLIINNVPPSSGFINDLERIYKNDPAKGQTIFREAKKVFNSLLTTLGGAICSLSQTVWSYTRRLGDISKWFKDYVNLEMEYIRRAWEILGATGWVVPEYLRDSRAHNLISEALVFVRGFVYNGNGIVERGIIRGSRDYCECMYVEPYGVTLLARIIYDLVLAMLLGVSDVTLKLRIHGRSSYSLCEDLAYPSGDVFSHEDLDAIVVFFRET
jgi:hypothetical protein